jgi:hypothetical protein
VQASTLTIATVVYGGINGWDIDPRRMAQAFVHGARDALESVAADAIVDDPRIVHVHFDDIAADPVGIVRKAYSQWELPYSASFEDAMRSWLQDPANRSDRYGRYDYSCSVKRKLHSVCGQLRIRPRFRCRPGCAWSGKLTRPWG